MYDLLTGLNIRTDEQLLIESLARVFWEEKERGGQTFDTDEEYYNAFFRVTNADTFKQSFFNAHSLVLDYSEVLMSCVFRDKKFAEDFRIEVGKLHYLEYEERNANEEWWESVPSEAVDTFQYITGHHNYSEVKQLLKTFPLERPIDNQKHVANHIADLLNVDYLKHEDTRMYVKLRNVLVTLPFNRKGEDANCEDEWFFQDLPHPLKVHLLPCIGHVPPITVYDGFVPITKEEFVAQKFNIDIIKTRFNDHQYQTLPSFDDYQNWAWYQGRLIILEGRKHLQEVEKPLVAQS
ncbi:hypothetical protein CN918_30770 [Priestia megaterium]|nr:hypothetical protein CN918_30770 [Priestia megaterium]